MAASDDSGKERPAEDPNTGDIPAADDELFARRERPGRPPLGVSEFVRRAIETTMGQVQNQSGLPKEAINYLLQQGDRGRREIVRIVAKEVGDFLRATDVSSEVVKILTNVQVDFNAQLRFKRNPDGTLSPEVTDRRDHEPTEDLPSRGFRDPRNEEEDG